MKKIPFIKCFALLLTLIIFTSGCRSINNLPSQLQTIQLQDTSLEINITEFGTAESILIQTNERNLMIDSGVANYERSIIEFLTQRNIKTLDYLIITHQNYNLELLNTLEDITIQTVILPTSTKNDTINYNFQLIYLENELKIPLNDAALTIHPLLDSQSLIATLDYGFHHILFVGSASERSLNHFLTKNESTFSIVKLPNFKSSLAEINELLNAIEPTHSIISSGGVQLHIEFLKLLSQNNIQTFFPRNGSITIHGNEQELTFTQQLNKFVIS